MNIFSWNVSRNNSNGSMYDLLSSDEYDVICLQEVNEAFLNELQERLCDYSIHVANETLTTASKVHRLYLVTLTKPKIIFSKSIDHESCKTAFYRLTKREISIQYSFVDICLENVEYRIFNSHLQCVAPPNVREKQFLQMKGDFREDRHNIICGDLNTFHKPFLFFIGPVLSYTRKDYLINESRLYNDLSGLKNPLNKKHTSVYMSGQLDYILLPEYFEVQESKVMKSLKKGSDHYPVSVKFNDHCVSIDKCVA